MEDYKTVGSKYFDNPYYLANVRRYIAEWKEYWGEHIPAMMETKAVPDGSSWGQYPSPKPQVGDSTATWTYNVYVHCFTPAALSGILFLTGESMVADDQGANFGPEMSALANCFKTRFALWAGRGGYSLHLHRSEQDAGAEAHAAGRRSRARAPRWSLSDWLELGGVLEAVAPKN